MTPSLTDLIARVERAEGPDRELDLALWGALIAKPVAPSVERSLAYIQARSVTGSLDAALALLEAVLPGWFWRAGHGTEHPGWAHLNRVHPDHCDRKDESTGWAATPALALVLALLRALESRG